MGGHRVEPPPGLLAPEPLLSRLASAWRRLRHGRWWLDERQRWVVRRTLAERSSLPVSLHRPDGRVVWCNPAFARLCGCGEDEWRERPVTELLRLPEGDAAACARLQALLAGPDEGRLELTGRRAGGAVVSMQAEVLQLPHFAGGEASVLVHWFDQTERVLTQARLESVLHELGTERQRLSHIIAGTQVGTWEINLVTAEARMDEPWAAMFGYRRAELEPWSRPKAREMLHPDDRAATDDQVRRHLAGELPGVDVEQRVRHRNGEWVWVHSRGKIATWTADGRPEWLVGSHMDIRERKRQQAALEEQRAYMRTVLASLPGVVFEFELDDAGRIRCTYLSDALEAMFGITPEQALRDSSVLLAQVPAEDVDSLYAAIARSARDLALLEHEYRIPGQRRVRWLGLHARPSHTAEGRLCWHGMLLDVTRRHELADQLAAAREQAEQANRAKSAFLATMSHEIRSPMNGVLGMTDVLMSATGPEDRADAVETIRESARALLGLIDDILDFSKIEAGRLELERLALNPGQLLEAVAESVASSSAAEGVAVSVQIAPDVPARVLGDPTRLRQVLFNLLGNAVKFCRHDPAAPGRVRARLQRAEAPGPGLVFCIEDDGIGMDESTQARLFHPFTQADASTTRRFGGTGLGLAIVGRLVEAMQGTVRVQSRPGAGTRFEVQLPLPPDPAGVEATGSELAGLACVLIGGDDTLAAPVAQALRGAGAELHQLPGLEALAGWCALQAADGRRTVAVLPRAGTPAAAARDLPDLAAARRSGCGDIRFLIVAGDGRPQPLQILAPDVGVVRALRRQVLWRAVASLAGRASPDLPVPPPWAQGTPPAATDRATAARTGRLVLVADDDATNRKVAQRQLQLLGLLAEVAADGEDAFERWREGGYAALLTDLHMPRLDGYGLAARVRADEARRGAARTPILALTANALRGEELRAQDAGIDECLVKPIALEALQAALARWLPARGAAAVAPAPGDPAGSGTLDLAVLRALVGDEPGVLSELLAEYRRSLDSGSAEIRRALLAGDTAALAGAAHKLKSASRAIGARDLGQCCEHLEQPGTGRDAAARAQAGREFERCVQALLRALDDTAAPA